VRQQNLPVDFTRFRGKGCLSGGATSKAGAHDSYGCRPAAPQISHRAQNVEPQTFVAGFQGASST